MGVLEAGRQTDNFAEKTEVIITGTGIPTLDANRAGAGVLIRHRDIAVHFDAGRGTAMRVIEAGTDIADLDAVFLTHYHSDHVIGLHDFFVSRWIEDDLDLNRSLQMVAPNGATMRYCQRMVELWDDDLAVRAAHNSRSADPKVELIGFDTPTELVEVWAKSEVRVLAGPVRHEPVIGAVGYRVETPDGVVVISGDTTVCPEVAALAEGADVVVYEAMRTAEILKMPPEIRFIADYHADTKQIGQQMAALAIPTLMLTHLIPPPSSPEEAEAFATDVRSGGYTGSLLVCNDLDRVTLGSGPGNEGPSPMDRPAD